MEIQGKLLLIKYLMFFFNFAFWLCGLLLTIVSTIIYVKYSAFFSYADSKFANMALMLMILGAATFVLGFLGCCGADKENYCMVMTFALLLSVILMLAVIAGSLGFVYKSRVDKAAVDALNRAIVNYNRTLGAQNLLDWTQKHIKCCGNNSPNDFVNITCNGNVGVPSCYDNGKCDGKLYPSGCKQGFIKFMNKNLLVIGTIGVGAAFVQLMGIVLACTLMKMFDSQYNVV